MNHVVVFRCFPILRKFLLLLCALTLAARGQTPAVTVAPIINTIAGNGTSGFSGDNGPATSAHLNGPYAVAVDAAGNVYFPDTYNNRIRKVAPTGIITTFAGTGNYGFSGDGGPATDAMIGNSFGVAVDASGNVYFSDTYNNRVRRVDTGGTITTVAGNGTGCSPSTAACGDGGQAASAELSSPYGVAVDAAGNLYIADSNDNRIRRVSTSGVITTVAGNGTGGFSGDGGLATSAELNSPKSAVPDAAGNLYIADYANNRIRKVDTSGHISTIAGTGSAGFSGDGGLATSAALSQPWDFAVDATGNLYIADTYNSRVRKIDPSDIITTVVGNGTACSPSTAACGDGGLAINANLNDPYGVAVTTAGNLYIADTNVQRIRMVSTSSVLSFPQTNIGQASASQNLVLGINEGLTISSIAVPQSAGGSQEYVVGTVSGCSVGSSLSAGTICTIPITFHPAFPGVRGVPIVVTTSVGTFSFALTGIGLAPLVAFVPGVINTIAGTGVSGFSGDGGPATSAELNYPWGLAVDWAGNVYIAEESNYRIRKLAPNGTITTFAGDGISGFSGDNGPATSARLSNPYGVAVDAAGNVYLTDTYNNRIRKVDVSGTITTFAGNGSVGFSGDGGPATSAGLDAPEGLGADAGGNIYIADTTDNRIRKVDTSGTITTFAGNGSAGFSGDGSVATSAMLNSPRGLAADAAGNIYIADFGNNRIRKVNTLGDISTIAGNGTPGFSGDGGPATSAMLNSPSSVVLDAAGNLYISEPGNERIRKVDTSGIITTVAGTLSACSPSTAVCGDGGPATSGNLNVPYAVALDQLGNIIIGDTYNQRIRKVSGALIHFPTPTTVGVPDSTDSPQSVTLVNIGNEALTFPAPSSGTNPSITPSAFSANSATTCPQLSSSSSPGSLASGASCLLAVNFTPASAGANTGSLVFTNNSLNATSPYATQTIPLNGTGVAVSTTTTVTSSMTPSTYGQSVTLTATVAPTTGSAVPAGTVQFYVDGTAAGSAVTLASGQATYTTSALGAGTHSITAIYTPDASGSFITSTSAALPQVVGQATLTVTADNHTRVFGAANPTLTYLITGFVNGQNLGTSGVSGTPSLSTTATTSSPVGPYTITATLGTLSAANYTFTFANGTLTVTQASGSASSSVLTALPTTVQYGDTSALTAVVSPAGATGTVTFTATPTGGGAAITLGTASAANNGTAAWPESTLAAGTYNIVAQYNGDVNIGGNTSNTVQLTVIPRHGPGGTTDPALTVTVNNATRTTTQANPPFSYTLSGELVNDDTPETALMGTASFSTTAGTIAGTFAITVTGLTSANYVLALLPGTLIVVPTSTTTTLATSPASPQWGDPVTLTATVSSTAVTGTVSFFDGTVDLGQGTVSGGVATLMTTMLSAGMHSITAIYNGDSTYASSVSPVATVTVAKKTAPGGGAALTVTVQNASRQFATANPQFEFVVTGTLVNGDTYATAVTGVPVYSTTATPTSPAGSTYPISVSGLASQNYVVNFVNGTLTIVSASTTTALSTSATSVQYGDPVALTANVTSSATGTVDFVNGSNVLGQATLSGGVATLTTTTLPAGTYVLTAVYLGDGNNNSSTSPPVVLTVTKRTGTGPGGAALTVTVNNATRAFGEGNPAFTYTVTGTLVNDDTYATAVTGVPVFSTPATAISPVGNYPISVSNLVSANYVLGFVNGTLTVIKGTPSVVLTSSLNPSLYGLSVTFVATTSAGATGTVTFLDGTSTLGTATLSGGTASFTTSTLGLGTHLITAVYSGDSNFVGFTSPLLSQVVGGDFAIAATPASQIIPPGATGSYTISVTPLNAQFPSAVALTVSGLPAGATASLSPTSVTPGSTGANSTLTISVPSRSGGGVLLRRGPGASLLIPLLLLPFALRRRERGRVPRLLLWMVAALASFAAMTGCGSGGYFNQPEQSYTITITGTSGSLVHSTTVTLTVE